MLFIDAVIEVVADFVYIIALSTCAPLVIGATADVAADAVIDVLPTL